MAKERNLSSLCEMNHSKGEEGMESKKVKAIVGIGMLSGISYILMLLNFPLPPFPKFLMVDFSDIPALIAAIVMGPMAGVLVEFLKNVLDVISTGSDTGIPIGHFANFLAGILFILPTYYIYSRLKNKKGLIFALLSGTFIMATIMSIINYFILLPLYTMFLNFPPLSAPETRELVIYSIFPFNLVKGTMITVLFMILFIKMQDWLIKQQNLFRRVS